MNDTVRLLYVSHSFPLPDDPLSNVGGMQRAAVELAEVLEEHPGIELQRMVLHTSGRWEHLESFGWVLVTLFRVWRQAKRGEMDVVLFSSMVSASMAPFLRRRLTKKGIPMAAIAHGRDVTLPGLYQYALVRRTLRALDAVLPVSRATGEECVQRGLPSTRMCVIPNGVNIHRNNSISPRPGGYSLPDTEVPEGGLLLCSVGRFVKRKGFAWFVEEVMPQLPEDVHYWIVGSGPEGKAIEAAVLRCGLSPRVRLLGRLSDEDIIHLYHAADLFVMPNIPIAGDMEGFGIVMLESGLSATPAIAASLEGICDVVTEGENGHLVASGDARAFADAILSYYHDRPLLEAVSKRTSHHTATTFSWEAVAQRHVAYLQALRVQ